MTIDDAELTALSDSWNQQGREYFTEYSKRLEQFYRHNDEDVDLDMEDPRSTEMGNQVVAALIEFNATGQASRGRKLFDPAHTPLMDQIKQTDAQLMFATIMGPDEFLVRRGSAWQGGVMLHLQGDVSTELNDIQGVCRSRNRNWLVLARTAGLELRNARLGVADFGNPPVAAIAWPDAAILRPKGMTPEQEVAWEAPEWPLAIEQLGISDDGTRVVVSCYRQGILLASTRSGQLTWTLLWPDNREPLPHSDDAEYPPSAGDMTHVAISRDGNRLAFGSQDAGHFLAEIDSAGIPKWYATAGHQSEYPHFAVFSDDGNCVALNSCHMYNGATIAFNWEGNRGVTLPSYEEHDEAPVIEYSMRVYAGIWLDGAATGTMAKSAVDGGFLLAGGGLFRIVTPTGPLISVQGFGSTASSVDYCPESKRLIVASYSGVVHVYNPFEEELPGRIDGMRARREVTRWLTWPHLPNGPIRW